MGKLKKALIAIAVVSAAIQAVPYGRFHANPPVTKEPTWDKPETRELAVRACFDCHSNQVVWPWYSNIAPVSWLVQRDVNEGRSKLNLSEFDRPQRDARNAAKQVRDGEMPMPIYLPLHPEARLSADEKQQLIAGLAATLGENTGERRSR